MRPLRSQKLSLAWKSNAARRGVHGSISSGDGFGGGWGPSTVPWTRIGEEGDATTFYAGEAGIELHRTEIANYRQNLWSGMLALWSILRSIAANSMSPAFDILTVMADSWRARLGPMPAAIWSRPPNTCCGYRNDRQFYHRAQRRAAIYQTATGTI